MEVLESAASPEAAAAAPSLFKKRGAKAKANIRKRAASPPPTRADSDDDDYTSSEDEAGQRVKRRKKRGGAIGASSKDNAPATTVESGTTVFAANRDVPITDSNDATKASNWYDDDDPNEGLFAKNLLGTRRNMPAQKDDAATADGTYKGLAKQTSFVRKNPDAPNRAVGPIKAPTNIRTITVTDYTPDVCKDYKNTGFCGFGDNCKFLHAREDYKAGWQLDKEWESVTKGKKNLGGTIVASADRTKTAEEDDDEEDALLEGIPFVCLICKGPYKAPIKTSCGHYFCEPCALKLQKTKKPLCPACGTRMNGIFNSAGRLGKLLERKRERAARRRQAAIVAGEEVSEEEEDA